MKNNKVDYFINKNKTQNLNKKAIRSGGLSVISRMTSHIIKTGSIFVLARLISPEEFGIFTMAFSFIGFFIILNDLGLTDAVIQKEKLTHSQISSLFWINLLFSSSIVLLLIIIAPYVGRFFKESEVTIIVILLSFSFIIAGSSIQHRGLLKRNLQFKEIAIIEVIATILCNIIAIILAFFGWSYLALVARQLSRILIISIIAWYFCKWRPGIPKYDPEIKPLITFGLQSLGNFFINNIAFNLDKTLIGRFFGKAQLGFYHKAYHLAALPTNQLSMSLFHVSVSTLSKLNDDPEKYRKYYLSALEVIAFIGFPISFYIAVMSKYIILLLIGSKWLPSAELFSILGLGAGIQLIYSTCGWLHVSQGKAKRWLRWGIVASIFIIIAIIVGLFFGLKGVAVAYTAIYYIIVGPALYYAGKPMNLKLTSIVSVLWRYFIASVISGLCCWIVFVYYNYSINIVLNVLISFFIYSISYLIILTFLYMSLKPILQFISIMKKFLPGKK
ncbi:MAG: lipopolysaccharide biosynthesis protein [Spirochaetes bacterium]|nr:lipopolysaccharide biosynthesis protein [Spirochaetota bacterium]